MRTPSSNSPSSHFGISLFAALLISFPVAVLSTPANKAGLVKYYDAFLSKNLGRCTTCHLPNENTAPESLDEFPHNPFGARLRAVTADRSEADLRKDIAARLARVAGEDSDGDGVPNEEEILVGHNPGDTADTPSSSELTQATNRRTAFREFLGSYRWQPFEQIQRPAAPEAANSRWVRNPIDPFVAADHRARNLKANPEASKEVLLRRVYLDLIGLAPSPEQLGSFMADTSADAYEKVVDRLLNDPRYGERWGRHWMDVWRYSDWAGWSGGNQIRDSKHHIWRWRDWIVESLNADKGYDRMLVEMLAADELAPEDTNLLRATGYLVRNYKMLSREQWLEDTVKHTSQAFLGITMGCAKCHDHMSDPISQTEYYEMRAIFEPHQVRTDRIPGEPDAAKDGLVRVFDVSTNAPTYFFARGDERRPDTNRVMSPGVPVMLRSAASVTSRGGLKIERVKLPPAAAFPDKRDFVIRDLVAASEKALAEARQRLRTNSAVDLEKLKECELSVSISELRRESLLSTLKAEALEDAGRMNSAEWDEAATRAGTSQKKLVVLEAQLKLHTANASEAVAQKHLDEINISLDRQTESSAEGGHATSGSDKTKLTDAKAEKARKDLETARKKTKEARKAVADAEKELAAQPPASYKPRSTDIYPDRSTGRRLAFANWVASCDNPLTARVAVNHIWQRHFGRGLVPTPADFGRNGRAPSHPQLLDWLAAEFMEQGWSMKALHRLIVTSSTYRMSSIPQEANLRIDPDNVYLWRMNSRRMEAEVVRDNLLYVAGNLDSTMGGSDIDHKLGLTSKRRSLYLRIAAEKEVEFLKIFDGPSVTECYERRPTVLPQQALALANSSLALSQARVLARRVDGCSEALDNREFVKRVFEQVLSRPPNQEELRLCVEFLMRVGQPSTREEQTVPSGVERAEQDRNMQRRAQARENLALVLFNHNDFVTIR